MHLLASACCICTTELLLASADSPNSQLAFPLAARTNALSGSLRGNTQLVSSNGCDKDSITQGHALRRTGLQYAVTR